MNWGCLQLRVSHKAAIKVSAGAAVISRLAGGEFTPKLTPVEDFRSLLNFILILLQKIYFNAFFDYSNNL